MSKRLKETVIVVGGSGGIGKGIIKKASTRADRIIATYKTKKPTIKKVEWHYFDINNEDSWKELENIAKNFSDRLITLIFCIGIPSSKNLIVDTPIDEWIQLYKINCLSFIKLYLLFKNIIRKNKSSVIVLSSDTTVKCNPKNGSYSSSKSALEATVITLAKEEIKYGVRINILCPSLLDSPLGDYILKLKGIQSKKDFVKNLPLNRLLKIEEVSEIVLSIAMDSHWSYISGQVIRVSNN